MPLVHKHCLRFIVRPLLQGEEVDQVEPVMPGRPGTCSEVKSAVRPW